MSIADHSNTKRTDGFAGAFLRFRLLFAIAAFSLCLSVDDGDSGEPAARPRPAEVMVRATASPGRPAAVPVRRDLDADLVLLYSEPAPGSVGASSALALGALPPPSGGGSGHTVVASSSASASAVAAAAEIDPRRWLRSPVRFDVRQYPLSRLLREFCAAQGVACQVSPALSGMVTGRFEFSDPGEFLDLLALAQHMNWYYDGGLVHFFDESEVGSNFLPMEGRREEVLRRTLVELGLFDPRFGWRTADNGKVLLVQGPAMYLDRIKDILERQVEVAAAEAAERELGVFRLKHAWAADQTVNVGTGSATVPGVASLLRQILSETPAEAAVEPGVRSGEPQLLKGTGVVARRDAPPPAPVAASSAAAFVQADARLNAVLVWDYRENMPRYRAIVEMLDQSLTLVEIRAAIIDVEADRMRELGITWEVKDKGGNWTNNAGANVGSGDNRVTYDSIAGDGFQYATIYTKGLDQFMARVSALEKDGNANVLSRPSVLTQDNIQATLEHTETFYVKLTGDREVDLADITTGLTLRVTPHVVESGEYSDGVQLAVHIVNGTSSYDKDSQVDSLPRVRQSTITTQAVVYEGEALVIGGYYNEVRSNSISGVPILKNIPVMGALFRTKSSQNTKSERLFVLSPRIIRPGESPMGAGSEAERAFEVSPGRKTLDGPAFQDSTPKQSKRLRWNNPQPDGGKDYTW